MPAFHRAAELLDELPYTHNWWRTYPGANKSQLAVNTVGAALRNVLLSELPWKTPEAWQAETAALHAGASQNRHGVRIANADPSAASLSLNKWDQLFGTAVDFKDLDRARSSPGYAPAALGTDNPAFMAAADRGVAYADTLCSVVADPSFARSGEQSWRSVSHFVDALAERTVFKPKVLPALNGVSIPHYLSATAKLGQKALRETLADCFSGSPPQVDVSQLLDFGNFLGTNAHRLAAHHGVLPQ